MEESWYSITIKRKGRKELDILKLLSAKVHIGVDSLSDDMKTYV